MIMVALYTVFSIFSKDNVYIRSGMYKTNVACSKKQALQSVVDGKFAIDDCSNVSYFDAFALLLKIRASHDMLKPHHKKMVNKSTKKTIVRRKKVTFG
jgi:hypothetical protein